MSIRKDMFLSFLSIMDNCVTYISFNRSYTDRKLQNKCGISYAVFYKIAMFFNYEYYSKRHKSFPIPRKFSKNFQGPENPIL